MYRRDALQRNISGRLRLSLLLTIVSVVIGVLPPGASMSAEPTKRPAVAEERLLQQFISSALNQKPAPAPPAASTQSDTALASPNAPGPAQPDVPSPQLPASYSKATFKMVLALAATVAILALGGVVCRRYLLQSPWFGQRGALLRVIARVNITPKAAVALVEVPGKVLVIGVTGNSVTGLSELPATTVQPDEAVQPRSTAVSFAETLERQTHNGNGYATTEDSLLGLSERIQRKVRNLKQL